ncbi:aromatic amino acid lyase, partial [Staphylococcus epidermidis]
MVTLNGNSLTFSEVKKVLYDRDKVHFSEDSMKRVEESRIAVEKIVSEERIVYGITTGFGKFSDVLIGKE